MTAEPRRGPAQFQLLAKQKLGSCGARQDLVGRHTGPKCLHVPITWGGNHEYHCASPVNTLLLTTPRSSRVDATSRLPHSTRRFEAAAWVSFLKFSRSEQPTSSMSSPLPREMQCAYRSKFCDAPRATKLDGTLHKLCDFHRRKANANQQRLHKRKKRILEQQAAAIPQTPKMKRARFDPESPQSTTEPIDGFTFQNNFDLLEVRILEVLLFGSECNATRQPAQVVMKDENVFCPVQPVPVFDGSWSVTL